MNMTDKLVTKDKKRLSYLTFLASIFTCSLFFPQFSSDWTARQGMGK